MLERNGLNAIPDLEVLTQLRSLEVKNEPLAEFPHAILRRGAPLEVLTLSRVGLKEWPKDMGLLTELRALDVSENALKTLPDALTSFDKLEILRANENVIVHIPDDIGRLRNLHTLELRKNKVDGIPASIGALRELVTLDLGTNRIPSLPASFFELSKLKTLSLQNNLLDKVPDELARLGALETLLLQTNPATRGKKNQAAEALLKAIQAAGAAAGAGAAAAAAAAGTANAADKTVDTAAEIALRTQLEIGDLGRARALALANPKAAIEPLIRVLEDPLAKLRTRALGLLAEVLPDPFAGSLEGAQVLVLGKMGALKAKTVKTRLAGAGATLVTSAEDHAAPRRIWVVGELAGLSGPVPEDVTLAAIPQLQAWLVADAKPHLMQAAPSLAGAGAKDDLHAAESLGALLRSPVLENVQLGLKLADEGGVPTLLHPLLLALARAHDDTKVRKHAARLFDTYADAGVKLAVSNALGSLALVSGRDEKANKAYVALEKVAGFDVDAFAFEVVRISGIGLEHMMTRPSPWPLRALATCVVEGVLKLATVGGRFGAQLRALPDDIGDLESIAGPVRGVVIEIGRIRALPPSFAKLVALETVALPGARLDVFPAMIRGLPKLRKLSLVGELAGIEAIGGRTSADAARPTASTLPPSLATLEELDIESSAPIPESIGGLVGLRRLRWSGSNVVPSSIGRLAKLESLDLSGGTFETVPPEVWKLPLRSLRLRGCGLTEIPDGLGDLAHLEKLDLSAIDSLSRLPPAMSRLPKLRTLHMHSLRGVHELPPLDHLEELYMSYSAITDPVASLSACPSLKDLHVSITRYSTPGFTNDQLESVRAALPHLRINVQ